MSRDEKNADSAVLPHSPSIGRVSCRVLQISDSRFGSCSRNRSERLIPPQRRDLDFETFDDVLADLDRLHKKGYDRTGQWDLSQMCDHLAFFIEGSLDGHAFEVPWLFKALFGRLVLRRILSQGRMRAGVPTPQKPPPAPGGDELAAVDRLRRVLARLCEQSDEFHDSPFFGHLTPDEWRRMHLIHCTHHLSFLVPRS